VSSAETSESTESVGYYTSSLSNTYYVKVVGKIGQHDPDRPYTLKQITAYTTEEMRVFLRRLFRMSG